jgi:hypothetical protein
MPVNAFGSELLSADLLKASIVLEGDAFCPLKAQTQVRIPLDHQTALRVIRPLFTACG